MDKIIVAASRNRHKIEEIEAITRKFGMRIISRDEAGIPPVEIVEDGETFEENSLKKAKEIMKLCGKITLADDSGLMVDYLGGAPGVYSARYMGEDTSYDIKNANLIQRLEGVPKEKRIARFVAVIAAVLPDKRVLTAEGTMEGYIGYAPEGENGFGYDPILFLDEYGCSSAALSREQKNAISHRGKALREMRALLEENM